MNTIILAALLTCTTGQAQCTAIDAGEFTFVNICDVEPESAGAEPAKLKVRIKDTIYHVKISPSCDRT